MTGQATHLINTNVIGEMPKFTENVSTAEGQFNSAPRKIGVKHQRGHCGSHRP
jgi:hypothetical protein